MSAPVFQPEVVMLRGFHPLVLEALIHAILRRIMAYARRGGKHATLKAIHLVDFYPFRVEWSESCDVLQMYIPAPHDYYEEDRWP